MQSCCLLAASFNVITLDVDFPDPPHVNFCSLVDVDAKDGNLNFTTLELPATSARDYNFPAAWESSVFLRLPHPCEPPKYPGRLAPNLFPTQIWILVRGRLPSVPRPCGNPCSQTMRQWMSSEKAEFLVSERICWSGPSARCAPIVGTPHVKL
ncbi:unnamed protein product [Prorocentrum cordatum]|uniref:Uncharacterized protein n=1 Tax=Prorocentrum cordatum TaxID=2364126 RepID=A0ABN9SL18_9DINO|nr:unnamed protein product [Polarella glacialis]